MRKVNEKHIVFMENILEKTVVLTHLSLENHLTSFPLWGNPYLGLFEHVVRASKTAIFFGTSTTHEFRVSQFFDKPSV
jgi:hypothetical protein